MDELLTRRLATDLDGAFESLVRAHQDRLYSIALRSLGNAHDAEDAAQDAFVRAYRALAAYDPARVRDLDVRAWLTTILLNVVRNRARAVTSGMRPLDAEWDAAAAAEAGPDRAAERHEATARWAGLVASLPPRYREPVLLRHVDGCSYAEMATILGRAEGTLKAQVHRGIELLRAAFEADERATSRRSAEPPRGAGRSGARAPGDDPGGIRSPIDHVPATSAPEVLP